MDLIHTLKTYFSGLQSGYTVLQSVRVRYWLRSDVSTELVHKLRGTVEVVPLLVLSTTRSYFMYVIDVIITV